MAFTKAKIKIFGDKGERTVNVLFNPNEYNLTEGANYSEKTIPGLQGPLAQYIAGTAATLTMTLMFDTYQTDPQKAGQADKREINPSDVTVQTEKIAKLARIDGGLHRPPLVQFLWGPLSFKGFIKNVNTRYTMFMENGMPVRARMEVTFQQYVDVKETKQQTPFESPDRTKRRTIEQGMHLWSIAHDEYGDAGLWRVIALANGIMHPNDIYPGQVLKVPAL